MESQIWKLKVQIISSASSPKKSARNFFQNWKLTLTPEMTYSQAGLSLTESFEGCKLSAYQDPKGVWTIGYGHTGPEVVLGLVWTLDQCQVALAKDILWAASVVNNHVRVSLDQRQFDALVDFTFNDGSGNFENSTLLKLVNSGDLAGADEEFGKWVESGGVVLSGLVRRRLAESTLFAS